jgi:phage terminase large subunit GpA-like protein
LDCRNYANAAVKALSPDFDALDRRLKGLKPEDPQKSEFRPEKSTPNPEQKKAVKSNKLKKYYDEW